MGWAWAWAQAQRNVAIGGVFPGPASLFLGGVRGKPARFQRGLARGGVVVVGCGGVVERVGRRVAVERESRGGGGHHRRVGGGGAHHHAWRLRLRRRRFPRIHRGSNEKKKKRKTKAKRECGWIGS